MVDALASRKGPNEPQGEVELMFEVAPQSQQQVKYRTLQACGFPSGFYSGLFPGKAEASHSLAVMAASIDRLRLQSLPLPLS